MTRAPEGLNGYYADAAVRARIIEYCGGSSDRAPTAVFLAGITGREGPFCTWERAPRRAVTSLDDQLEAGADIARSLWDRASLLFHLDFDYQNVDVPGEPYHHPFEVFWKLEPVYCAARHVLRRFDLDLLPLVTGGGYHFTGHVPLGSAVVDRLAALVPEPPVWQASVPERRLPAVTDEITERSARAYVGAGMAAEFLAHVVRRRGEPRSTLPIVLNNTIVGSGLAGRECTSIDLSAFGDPMDVRHIRVAFSAYQKHRFRPDLVANRAASERPPFIAVPRGREPLSYLLGRGRDFAHAARLARSRSAVLPDVSNGVARLLDAYERSKLAAFHREFYATPRLTNAESDALFRSLSAAVVPPCVLRPLAEPNDSLLRPTVIQHVTRALMAEGFRPRDIAAVVRARYADECGWGTRWSWMDAETRAEFDVRVFAGLVAAGDDRAIDFNCRSAQEKDLCPWGECRRDLREQRGRLLEVVAA